MKIGVMGAGGLGGYFGGVLAEAGRDVTLAARGPHLAALRAGGLRLTSVAGGTRNIAVAAASPAEAGVQDLVLFGVKTYSTEQAAEAMRPMVGPETLILALQNGVESADRIAAALGPVAGRNVLPGVAYIASQLRGPGEVAQVGGPCRIVFGEPGGGRSDRCRRVLEALDVPGIDAVFSEYVQAAIWNKFIFICASAGMTAAARATFGQVTEDPGARAIFDQVMDEVEAVGRAAGVRLDGEREKIETTIATFGADTTTSMAVDVAEGRRLEIEALNGAVCRLGRGLGVPTPANEFIYTMLRLQDPGTASA